MQPCTYCRKPIDALCRRDAELPAAPSVAASRRTPDWPTEAICLIGRDRMTAVLFCEGSPDRAANGATRSTPRDRHSLCRAVDRLPGLCARARHHGLNAEIARLSPRSGTQSLRRTCTLPGDGSRLPRRNLRTAKVCLGRKTAVSTMPPADSRRLRTLAIAIDSAGSRTRGAVLPAGAGARP